MTPTEVERKVHQLDNDVESIYELLNRISITQQRHGNRVRELTEMVAAHDTRFDAIDGRLDALEGRLGALEGRLGALEGRLDAVEGLLGQMETTLGTVLEILQGRPPGQ